jgi:hypothetical protein
VISENTNDGVYSGFYSIPVISYCNITDNDGYGVRNVDQSLVVLAENNWWGDATGPYNPITNPGGLGDTVSHYVDYDPWLTSPGIAAIEIAYPRVLDLQVSPNPFHRQTKIRYSILARPASQGEQNATIRIYGATGRCIKFFNLESSIQNQESEVVWYGTDQSGRRLPGGVYFLKLDVGDYTETTKIVFLR